MQINSLRYKLFIGPGRKAWPEQGCSIQQLTIFHRYIYAAPLLKIVLEDAANVVGRTIQLPEGELLTLEWGTEPHIHTYTFRLATIHRFGGNNTNFYQINAYYDNIKWLADGTTKSYKGPSSDAMKKIAEEIGLDPEKQADIDVTNDSQTWIGGAQRRYVFARSLAKRGYVNDESLMGVHFTHNMLRYRNINEIDIDKPICYFMYGQGEKTTYKGKPLLPITSYQVQQKSGTNFLMTGYRAAEQEQGLATPSRNRNVDEVAVRNRAGSVSRNGEIAGQVSTPKVVHSGVSSDNSHEQYDRAKYQNERGARILSNNGIEFTTNRMTNLAVFDPIFVRVSQVAAGATNFMENDNEMYDGPYIVYTRNIFISGNDYAEKIIAMREGITG